MVFSFESPDTLPKNYSPVAEAEDVLNTGDYHKDEDMEQIFERYGQVNARLDAAQGKFRDGIQKAGMGGATAMAAGVMMWPANWQAAMGSNSPGLKYFLAAGTALVSLLASAEGLPKLIGGIRELKKAKNDQAAVLDTMARQEPDTISAQQEEL